VNVLPVNDTNIEFAAAAIRAGELVGMPTETVYGLAADATNRVAVLRTFDLKRRPADNPLIVHVSDRTEIDPLVSEFPSAAFKLADAFWPGPLTLVLRRSEVLPPEVSAGLGTVAIRVPDHSVALELIRRSGRPISAPSANPFMGLSPTCAQDIDVGLAGSLACVLDAGPCRFGLESTVVDCTESPIRILRPGAVSRTAIEKLIGSAVSGGSDEHRSPGMYRRHYSPITPLRLAERLSPSDAGITFERPATAFQVRLAADPVMYASNLYSCLRRLDRMGLRELVIQTPPNDPAWEAVWDRLRKAAG
jgi:L-threonylcarbamoyladenylate synthase